MLGKGKENGDSVCCRDTPDSKDIGRIADAAVHLRGGCPIAYRDCPIAYRDCPIAYRDCPIAYRNRAAVLRKAGEWDSVLGMFQKRSQAPKQSGSQAPSTASALCCAGGWRRPEAAAARCSTRLG